LIDDQLYDQRPALPIQSARCTLRIRRDGARGFLTFKGPPLAGAVKTRDEFETEVTTVDALEAIVAALGYTPFFRAQKWREEFLIDSAVIAVDETPMGVFVEIEGTEEAIAAITARMGRSSSDWMLDSYQRLFVAWATARGLPVGAMMFDADGGPGLPPSLKLRRTAVALAEAGQPGTSGTG
jgi:adenylate cyclase class 2